MLEKCISFICNTWIHWVKKKSIGLRVWTKKKIGNQNNRSRHENFHFILKFLPIYLYKFIYYRMINLYVCFSLSLMNCNSVFKITKSQWQFQHDRWIQNIIYNNKIVKPFVPISNRVYNHNDTALILFFARYHSSILYIKRNILTYLSMLLVLSMNLTSNATVIFV